MKKLMLVLLGIVLVCVLLAHLGPMIALLISSGICYYAFRKFKQTESKWMKFLLGSIAIIALLVSITNLPALIGLVALIGLHYVYKHWQKKEKFEESDPFTNFEREWGKLQNS
ncbi:flagellar basal body rod protein [Bacillus sp. FJAT-47783]|uniref:lmo0954 family membrane protein n=1 Tax=Bacillus sp. FJAT-47783 TaxID=2922712 RepID=UPI001FABC745|nr:flagellar basal body rod protein [Bacillus sp. FJAT-47783]